MRNTTLISGSLFADFIQSTCRSEVKDELILLRGPRRMLLECLGDDDVGQFML